MKIKKAIFVLCAVVMILIPLTVASSAAEFTDVPENHPYKAAIDFCKDQGFVKGENATSFKPDQQMQRAHFAIIWCRSLNIKDDNHSFADITGLQQYFDGPAILLNGLGLFKGTSDVTFSPGNYITREQVAQITMRTYNLGVDNPEAYQRYQDHAQISEWARSGVNSCINADVFRGLYDGDNFKPQEPVTRAEICKLIYNIINPAYTVTIGTLTGGTITANPTHPHAGELVTLTVTPAEGKQLKTGTLKYDNTVIDGTTFTMPEKDVTITAEFEDKTVTLTAIEITTSPKKTDYNTGEELELEGLTVTAKYSDNSGRIVNGYTTTPEDGSTLNNEGTVTVNVYYKEGDVTQTTSFTVEVADSELK